MGAGVTIQATDGNDLASAVVLASATGDSTLIPAVVAKSIRVYKLILVFTGATTITFKSGGTALSGPMDFPANGTIALDMDGQPWYATGTNQSFIITSSALTKIAGTVYYTTSAYNTQSGP